MIKLTEKQKQVIKVYMTSDPDACDALDESTTLANALLRHKEFDLVQNSVSALRDALDLLDKFDCQNLKAYLVNDEHDENAWLDPGGNEHEFSIAKENFIKEVGL